MDRLHILDKNVPQSENILYIDRVTEGYPYLAYKNDNGSITSVIEGDTFDRPIHCSELINILLSMNPGIAFIASQYVPTLYYVFPNDEFSYTDMPTSLIPQINPSTYIRDEVDGFTSAGVRTITTEALRSIKICDNWEAIGTNIPAIESKITDLLEEVYPAYDKNVPEPDYEKEIRDSLGPYSVEIDTVSTVINMISPTTYTDTIDLGKLVERIEEAGVSGKADISVSYMSKGNFYNPTISIRAFEYLDTGDLYIPSFATKLGDVQLEYFNGILRAIPISEDVNECIISNCTVTYGNLERI